MSIAQNRNSEQLKEHTRLFGRFQQIRPDDSPEEIVKLIELVENGTLKEQGGTFVVHGSDGSEIDEFGERLSSSSDDIKDGDLAYNTAGILISEFKEEYFSVPRLSLGIVSGTRNAFDIPRNYSPLVEAAPAPWMQLAVNSLANFK